MAMQSMQSLHDLLVHELKDLYSAENQLLKALPKMAKNAQSPQLRAAFEQHARETEKQIERIERAMTELNGKPRGKKCVGMEALIEEGKEIMDMNIARDVVDAGLIGAAQKIEHYEIAGYGTARTYAQHLGMNNVARLMQQTLDEESATNEKLTKLAESQANVEAMTANGPESRRR
jgi:ferritin-like metal-binding protein YciE